MKKSLILIIFVSMFFIVGCGDMITGQKKELYGFYSWDGSVTELSIYSKGDAPIYYLSENEFFQFFLNQSHYSPFSSGGIYYGTIIWTDGSDAYSNPNIQYQSVKFDDALFKEAGVDISAYKNCQQFATSGSYTLFQMDDEIWVMERWRGDAIVISKLKKEDHYDFVFAVRDGERVRLLRDLSDPPIPDITDPKMSKDELLDYIGQTNDSRIVARLDDHIEDWYMRYYDEDSPLAEQSDIFEYTEYRVMEYDNEELRSWVSYVFWDSAEHYEEAKRNPEWNFLDIQNDTLLMTCRIYSYGEDLEPCYRNPSNFKDMNYEDMLKTLESNGYTII